MLYEVITVAEAVLGDARVENGEIHRVEHAVAHAADHSYNFV